jgi:hypothetical protein
MGIRHNLFIENDLSLILKHGIPLALYKDCEEFERRR